MTSMHGTSIARVTSRYGGFGGASTSNAAIRVASRASTWSSMVSRCATRDGVLGLLQRLPIGQRRGHGGAGRRRRSRRPLAGAPGSRTSGRQARPHRAGPRIDSPRQPRSCRPWSGRARSGRQPEAANQSNDIVRMIVIAVPVLGGARRSVPAGVRNDDVEFTLEQAGDRRPARTAPEQAVEHDDRPSGTTGAMVVEADAVGVTPHRATECTRVSNGFVAPRRSHAVLRGRLTRRSSPRNVTQT